MDLNVATKISAQIEHIESKFYLSP